MKRGSTRSPDEPPVARMRGRWRHPGAVPHLAALMRVTGVLVEMGESKKKRPISSYAIEPRQSLVFICDSPGVGGGGRCQNKPVLQMEDADPVADL